MIFILLLLLAIFFYFSMKYRKEGFSTQFTANESLVNTRNEVCSLRNSTACCPHMAPDDRGRYRATNEMTVLFFNNQRYELHTCCQMCADAMNELAQSNPSQFRQKYISKFDNRGNIIAKNPHTGREIQILKRIF